MKKSLALSLIIVAVFSIAPTNTNLDRAADWSRLVTWARTSVALSNLPPELVVPALLPTGLQDAELLEAWVRLYNYTEPFELWDGQMLTGRALAENLRDQAIPVVWDVQRGCGNGSCVHQFCVGERCTHEDGQPGVDPIYIYPGHTGNMPALVATLAHESFHRAELFGLVHDSKFEEFWACRISAVFDAHAGFKFEGYDPLVSGYLILWVRDNGLTPYYALPNYPPVIAAELASAAAR